MTYVITKSDGTSLGTILDGTVNTTTTSLTLVGQNYAGYGQAILNNFIFLLENFAKSTSPSNPLAGQLWWDTSNSQLKVYTGSAFKIISSATAQATAPTTTIAGDIWWDTDDEQLYVYNGTSPYSLSGWILVGPAYKKNNGKSGTLWEQITDTVAVVHNVLSVYLDGTRRAIISQDSTAWQPNTAISGFSLISQGVNLNSNDILNGTANNASYLGGVAAATYFRKDSTNTTTGAIVVSNDTGVWVGANTDVKISASLGTNAYIDIGNSNEDLTIRANVAGTVTDVLHIDGATGKALLYSDPTSTLGVATKQYVDNSFVNANLTGVPTAPTMPSGTSNTSVATTAFVNNAFQSNAISQLNSEMRITDTGTGSATLTIDGVQVLSASSSGVTLANGASATTQTVAQGNITAQPGSSLVATTAYARQVAQYWDGSKKFVSTSAPDDLQGNDGDFWFQREA